MSESGVSPLSAPILALGYSISACLLIVVNKWAVLQFPYPSLLTGCQLACAAAFAAGLGITRMTKVDALEWGKAIGYAPSILVFYICLWANSNLLKRANVDTFIMFRSLLPCMVQTGEILFLGSAVPGTNAVGSLVGIAVGAYGFLHFSGGLQLESLSWAVIYLVAMTTECLVTKKVVSHIQLEPWGLVLYNNLLAMTLIPFTFIQEPESMDVSHWLPILLSPAALAPVLLSCVMGITISYFGLNARKGLSATSFMVLGVVNKFASVIINFVVWEHHAPPMALFCLSCCIGFGVLYSQVHSPQKPATMSSSSSSEKIENDEKPLLEQVLQEVGLVDEKDVEV